MSCGCDPHVAGDGTWDMTTGSGPCRTWPMADDCSCLPAPRDMDDQQRVAVESATEILWRLTAGRFGLCREIVRPCRRPCAPTRAGGARMRPDVINGRWVNLSCGCGCPEPECDSCTCGTAPDTVDLPGPVHAPYLPNDDGCPTHTRYPVRVWIDGEPLDPDAFRVDGNTLMRVDGQRWPQCQDMTVAYDEPGGFGVEYWRGLDVPIGGRRAVAILACELWKKCSGASDCALPERVNTVTREGISYTFVDPMEFLSNGRTGLPEVDMWLSTVNPTGALSPPGVWSPDAIDVRREPVRSSPWRSRRSRWR